MENISNEKANELYEILKKIVVKSCEECGSHDYEGFCKAGPYRRNCLFHKAKLLIHKIEFDEE